MKPNIFLLSNLLGLTWDNHFTPPCATLPQSLLFFLCFFLCPFDRKRRRLVRMACLERAGHRQDHTNHLQTSDNPGVPAVRRVLSVILFQPGPPVCPNNATGSHGRPSCLGWAPLTSMEGEIPKSLPSLIILLSTSMTNFPIVFIGLFL